MSVLLGIDLGTQSVKALLADSNGTILCSRSHEYPVEMPQACWAVQDPQTWWDATCGALRELHAALPDAYDAISCIGLTGQMHGLVMLGADHSPVTPAIIWMDGRSERQAREIEECLPTEELREHMQNRVFPGFALPSLLWAKQNRPVEYERTCHVCSPKDYIRLHLTGELGCEPTDASATGAFDMLSGNWYWDLLDHLEISRALFPHLGGSFDIAGEICPGAAAETSLATGTPVAYGLADEIALLLGNGLCGPGPIVVNIGTGATVSAWSNEDRYDRKLRTHTFAAAPSGYAVYGAILGGGANMRWLRDNILGVDSYMQMSELAAHSPAGARGLLFLPYTCGERTPHMDSAATGAFFGARLDQDRGDVIRAVMEGVGFALKECLGILEELGLGAKSLIASGGGARSDAWMQVLADTLGAPLRVSAQVEQAALGACIAAGVAVGAFEDAAAGAGALVRLKGRSFEPDPKTRSLYAELYGAYRELYPATRNLMRRVRNMSC